MIEVVLAGLFGMFGTVSALRSLSRPASSDEDGRARFLIAVHDAAKALFWFSLGGFFLAYGLAPDLSGVRFLPLAPIAMAAVRLVAAAALARG